MPPSIITIILPHSGSSAHPLCPVAFLKTPLLTTCIAGEERAHNGRFIFNIFYPFIIVRQLRPVRQLSGCALCRCKYVPSRAPGSTLRVSIQCTEDHPKPCVVIIAITIAIAITITVAHSTSASLVLNNIVTVLLIN
ncbi:hypothetical protein BU24DRAFT_222406 [Aaosphaeria arxii CBS 175.79]|uniref:Uncharacterized protein n=1 Tax=Aaosphaeria arxii CBS 175.79 TaxID=1450172 RepID=A0A6A5XPH8_9PLEO|nr:uncharacterized protein BU24DRAFT_222406 [Aaosphaeria arxii CBS 175.79]KAF2014809.1 hypothetical protein BU24DRAFT_222406 [Aaosphaeria arxii CBS 175.79]